jgi:hypothetical protein
MRVGNLDVLAPLVDSIGVLGASVTKADPRLIPGNQNAPIGSDYFQINRQGQSPIILRIGQAKAWIDSNEQTLRAAPLLSAARFISPSFPSCLCWARAHVSTIPARSFCRPPLNRCRFSDPRYRRHHRQNQYRSSAEHESQHHEGGGWDCAYVYRLPGYAMGFDATNTSTERVVSLARAIFCARAGMPSKFPAITRITLDLKRNLTGTIRPTSDPTIFAFVVSSPKRLPLSLIPLR